MWTPRMTSLTLAALLAPLFAVLPATAGRWICLRRQVRQRCRSPTSNGYRRSRS